MQRKQVEFLTGCFLIQQFIESKEPELIDSWDIKPKLSFDDQIIKIYLACAGLWMCCESISDNDTLVGDKFLKQLFPYDNTDFSSEIEDTIRDFSPFLESLEPNKFIRLFSKQYKDGFTPLYNDLCVKVLYPLLKKLDNENLIRLLSLKNYNDTTLLFNPYCIEELLPLLKKLKIEDLARLFSIQNLKGKTILFYPICIKKIISLLEDFDIENLVKLFSFKEHEGYTHFEYSDCIKELLPFLKKLKIEDLTRLFSIQNNNGKTLLFFSSCLKLIIPLLEKMDIENLLKLFSITDNKGNSPIFQIKELLPILEKLKIEDLITLISIRYKGSPYWFYNKIFKQLLPLLQKMKIEDLTRILSIQCSKGTNILFYQTCIRTILPLLEKLDIENLVKLFSITNNKGHTIFQIYSIETFFPLFEKMKIEDLARLLSIQDVNGIPNWFYIETIEELIPLLEKLKIEDLVKLFSIKNVKGTPILFLDAIEVLLPFLKKLNQNDLVKLLSIQDDLGRIPLYFNKASQYLTHLLTQEDVIKLKSIKDIFGYSLNILDSCSSSPSWLTKDKYGCSTLIGEQEYAEKAIQMQKAIDAIWNSLIFGDEEGMVSSTYLMISVNGKTISYSPQEIKLALDVAIYKIIQQECWLGTPNKNEPEKVHEFYSQMLTNLLHIISLLGKKTPQDQAGVLIDIAKVELEGRCAAAYQSEIEQAKWVLDSDLTSTGIEKAFEKIATGCLLGCIEKLAREHYASDSHAYNQLLFSVGLASTHDPLSKLDIEDCQEWIQQFWEKATILKCFSNALKRLDHEMVKNWFYEQTPSDFDPISLEKQTIIKSSEQEIIKEIRLNLEAKKLDCSLINYALEQFQSNRWGDLEINLEALKHLSKKVLDQFYEASNEQEIKNTKVLFKSEILEISKKLKDHLALKNELNSQKIRLKNEGRCLNVQQQENLDELVKKTNELQTILTKSHGEYKAMKSFAKAKIKFKLELNGLDPVSKEDLETIMCQKREFDTKISQLAKMHDIYLSFHECGLISVALESRRKEKFSNVIFNKGYKLNWLGALKILDHIKVLDNLPLSCGGH